MASARPGGLANELVSLFTSKGWPVTDLARFRMQADDDGGDGDDKGGSDTDDDKKGTKQLTAEEIEAMQRALKKANKEAETTRLKLKEIEDRDKSETEKLAERARELEGNLTSAQATALRYEIALDKGIPKSIASRLQGSTREEMEKDADELLKTIGGTKRPQSFDGGAKDGDSPKGGSFLSQALANRGR